MSDMWHMQLDQGCYFSINHQMLQSTNGRTIVRNIPVDRLLLESDAPFTKGLNKKYTIDFNDVIYKHIGELYHQEIGVVKKRIKANFVEVLKRKEWQVVEMVKANVSYKFKYEEI